MPSKAEIARRTARFETVKGRVAEILATFPDVNVHLARQAARADHMWPTGWREYIEKWADLAPSCSGACCNPQANH